MGLLPGIAGKHKFEGIGRLNATVIFMFINTHAPGFTSGFVGKILWWFLNKFGMGLASAGVVLANIGVAKLETIIQRDDFKGTFDDMISIVDAKGNTLTKEEADAIDAKIMAVTDKFLDMSR